MPNQPLATVAEATCLKCGHPVDAFTHDLTDEYGHVPELDPATVQALLRTVVQALLDS